MYPNADTTTQRGRYPSPTSAFTQLVRRLRNASARYTRIAHQHRVHARPTHHAKRRANMLGLRIDTAEARACPPKEVSSITPPIVSPGTLWETSPSPPPPPAPTVMTHATAQHGPRSAGRVEDSHRDACMRGAPLRNLPYVGARKVQRPDGQPRVVLRLPPLKLEALEPQMPGAPRLRPRQLPEEDSDRSLSSVSSLSSIDEDEVMTPIDVESPRFSGFRITIPPLGALKRKYRELEFAEEEDDNGYRQPPKRFMLARWNESQRR